ncbi:putative DENN protein, partial [Pseudoloma neurophilia]
TNQISFFRFMMATEGGQSHFCYILPNIQNKIVIVSFSEDLVNSNFLAVFISNNLLRNNTNMINFLERVSILSPCNLRIRTVDKLICLSTVITPQNIEYNHNFIIKILSCILNERQVVIFSKNNKNCFDVILFFYHILSPFRYKFLIATEIDKRIENIIDSPFPYLLGTSDCNFRSKYPHVLFVDLDDSEVYNFKNDVIPFEKELRKKFRKYSRTDKSTAFQTVFREYFDILKNNIDIARENYIHDNIENFDKLATLISRPQIIQKKLKHFDIKFSKNFVQTRMFRDYMSNTSDEILFDYTIVQNEQIKYHFKKSRIQKEIPFIYAIFIIIISDRQFKLLFDTNFFDKLILEQIMPEIFRRFAQINEFEKIFEILQTLKREKGTLSPKLLGHVCYFDRKKIDVPNIIDLRNSVITVFELCACCGMTISNERIRKILKTKNLKINENEKTCNYRHHAIFVETSKNESFIYDIYEPEDLFLYIKRQEHVNLEKMDRNIFWNLITYFLVYDLPFNYIEPIEEKKCDIILEETLSVSCFNLLKHPSVNFDKN